MRTVFQKFNNGVLSFQTIFFLYNGLIAATCCAHSVVSTSLPTTTTTMTTLSIMNKAKQRIFYPFKISVNNFTILVFVLWYAFRAYTIDRTNTYTILLFRSKIYSDGKKFVSEWSPSWNDVCLCSTFFTHDKHLAYTNGYGSSRFKQ